MSAWARRIGVEGKSFKTKSRVSSRPAIFISFKTREDPFSANIIAISLPNPLPAPVIRVTFPLKNLLSSSLNYLLEL
jgi:hypothetical protein